MDARIFFPLLPKCFAWSCLAVVQRVLHTLFGYPGQGVSADEKLIMMLLRDDVSLRRADGLTGRPSPSKGDPFLASIPVRPEADVFLCEH